MAAVLGVSAYYHDAAAALVIDGAVVAAMQEERFSRVKNDPSLPVQAMKACLRAGKIPARALDAVVFYENPYAKLERVLVSTLESYPSSWRQFPRAMASQLSVKLWVLDAIASALGIDRARVSHRTHHESHAASAFFASPFDRAAVLTVDGVGEATSTAIWAGEDRSLRSIASQNYPHSLGLFYAALTSYLGFEVNEGEYKVMGLAAFGKPSRREEFSRLLTVSPDGSFELALEYFAHHTDILLGFAPKLEALLGPRRAPGKKWDLEADAEDRRYADVAATLQAITEEIMLNLARAARSKTGCSALCLAGGVALNAVANARLLAEGELFVQPAAGDAGGALGAAILGALEAGDPRPAPMTSAALGEELDRAEVKSIAEAAGLRATIADDPVRFAASKIAAGEIIAFADGRFEWGPRALGHRSLLALPSPSDVREKINRVIKRREPFRPFAPAVVESRAGEWFERVHPGTMAYMTAVSRVRADASLAAVTHVDGSARVQTVSASAEPRFHALLEAVGAASGAPIVLNTSLNGRGEPIAGGASDVIAFLLSHPVDVLVAGDVVVTK